MKMGTKKTYWNRSNLPITIKVKLWEVMKNNQTYPNFTWYLTNHPDVLSSNEWELTGLTKDEEDGVGKEEVKKDQANKERESKNKVAGFGVIISRDTFDSLNDELKSMPLITLAEAKLPDDLMTWERGRRGHIHLEISLDLLIKMHLSHRQQLAEASKRLADNFQSCRLESVGVLKDYYLGEWESDIVQQLASDAPTRWLLAHLKEEPHPLTKEYESKWTPQFLM